MSFGESAKVLVLKYYFNSIPKVKYCAAGQKLNELRLDLSVFEGCHFAKPPVYASALGFEAY